MRRTLVRGTGQVFITAGLIILLFAGYELWGTGISSARAQHTLYSQLTRQWGAAQAPTSPTAPTTTPGSTLVDTGTVKEPPIGSGIAILHIPRIWSSADPRVIVQGVALSDLARGPGHYPSSAMPGQVGNFAVAGHRATHGNGFMRLNDMRQGDAIVVETRTTWYTYRVTSQSLVLPTQTSVVDPVPNRPRAAPTQRLITLTTCDPWYSATHRLIISGVLQSSAPRTKGYLPPALKS